MVEPTLIAGLGGAAAGYAVLRHRARSSPGSAAWAPATWRFACGLLVLVVALASPLDAAAGRSLPLHMVQHQLLALLAAPLLASSGLLRLARSATGRHLVPSLGAHGAALAAVAAALVHLAVMLAWHVPAAYDAALASPTIHHLEHVTMLGTAVLAWAAVFRALADDRAVPGSLVGLAVLAVGGAVLGIVLLTAPQQLYASYADPAGLDGQRIAGALMKVGALVTYAGAAVVIAARWFQRLDAAEVAAVAGHGRSVRP